MNKNSFFLMFAMGVVACLAIGAWWYHSSTDDGQDRLLTLYGNVDIREADLAFNNSEHIDSMLVQEGDHVRKGQLLAALHSERMAAAVAAAEARVASSKAVLARLETGSRPEEISKDRADVAAARARLVDATVSYKRIKDLVGSKNASHQQLDDAKATLDMARAQLKVAQAVLALAIEGSRREDIEEARANMQAEEAQLVLAREVLKDASLYAPFAGVIRNRILEPGDMVTPQIPVFTLARTNPVWVRSYLPETHLGKVSAGMRADVSTDSYPGKSYPGWIGYISPTAEFTPKNVETPELRTRLVYQVRVYVCNPQDELRLGMPASVTIAFDQPKPDSSHPTPDCIAQENGQGEH